MMAGILSIALPALALAAIAAHKALVGPAPADHDPIPACTGRKLSYLLFLIGFVGLGATGAAALLRDGELGGWLLWAHLLLAPAFLAGLLGILAVTAHWFGRARAGAPEGAAGVPQRLLFWLMALLAWISLGSILACMVSYVPSQMQPELIAIHRVSGLALLFVIPLQAYALYRAR